MLTGREAGTEGTGAQRHPIRVTRLHNIYITGFPFLNRMAQHFQRSGAIPTEVWDFPHCHRPARKASDFCHFISSRLPWKVHLRPRARRRLTAGRGMVRRYPAAATITRASGGEHSCLMQFSMLAVTAGVCFALALPRTGMSMHVCPSTRPCMPMHVDACVQGPGARPDDHPRTQAAGVLRHQHATANS